MSDQTMSEWAEDRHKAADQRIGTERFNYELQRFEILLETGWQPKFMFPPDKDGEAASDLVHERFHGAVGDVLAGRVMPEARRQMQEALKNAPKPARSIPTPGSANDPRRIGWRI